MPEFKESQGQLTPSELSRYDRQLRFAPLGEPGQRRLKSAHVVVVGLGGLGGAAAMYLAAAGLGQLTLVDGGVVELSNLNRQILYGEQDIGKHKASVAADRLRQLNSSTRLNGVCLQIDAETVHSVLGEVDLVVDALDNMEARFILNEVCVVTQTPLIHGGLLGLRGEVSTIVPFQGPCLHCSHRVLRARKGPRPVVGAAAGLVASIQVLEAVKLLAGFGQNLVGQILYVDGETLAISIERVDRDPSCPVCGRRGIGDNGEP